MALAKEVLDALFVQATQHAALDRPALLIATSQRPVKWPTSRNSMVAPPGEERFAWWDLAEPELRATANAARATHRVLLLNDDALDERNALARMAWCLELASQWETSPDLLDCRRADRRAVRSARRARALHEPRQPAAAERPAGPCVARTAPGRLRLHALRRRQLARVRGEHHARRAARRPRRASAALVAAARGGQGARSLLQGGRHADP